MRSMWKAALFMALALGSGKAYAQCTYTSNWDFENGTASWTKTQGYFGNVENPSGSGNHWGVLRGASGYTSEITQSFTTTEGAGYYAFFLDTYLNVNVDPPPCTATLGWVSGGQTTMFTDTIPNGYNYGYVNHVFIIPAGYSSATAKISVTCNGLGRYVQVDNACIFFVGALP